MKVAYIMPTHFDINSVIAGGERYAHGLAKAMSEQTETALFTFSKETKTVMDGRLNIHHRRTLFPVGGIANPFCISFLADLKNFDVIHCLQFKTLVTDLAMISGSLKKKKVFVTDLAGGTYYCPSHYFPLWKGANGFLYISEFNRQLNHKVQAPHRILYGGVDTDFFAPDAKNLKAKKFLFVGRIFSLKGIHHLLEAMTPEMRVEIAGTSHDDAYMNRLKSLSRGKNVSFHEGISDLELLSKIQSSTAVVLPSLVDGGFTSAIESMACGTPVIGTHLGSLPEVVKDGETGLLVPPGNSDALREKLIQLWERPEQAARLGENGRKLVLEKFTWTHVAERCLEAYRHL